MRPASYQDAARIEALEAALLDPAVRRDRVRVDALLDADFTEIGRSGRFYDRAAITTLLAASPDGEAPSVRHFAVRMVADGLALATYDTPASRRSSLWRRHGEDWRLVFHQGTPLAGET